MTFLALVGPAAEKDAEAFDSAPPRDRIAAHEETLMKQKTKFVYRLACRFETAPATNIPMPDQQAAIQEGWRTAGNPYATSVKVLRAPEGSFSFGVVHTIK
jgi:hypothetical protein